MIARQGGLSSEAFYPIPTDSPTSPNPQDSPAPEPADPVARRSAAGVSQSPRSTSAATVPSIRKPSSPSACVITRASPWSWTGSPTWSKWPRICRNPRGNPSPPMPHRGLLGPPPRGRLGASGSAPSRNPVHSQVVHKSGVAARSTRENRLWRPHRGASAVADASVAHNSATAPIHSGLPRPPALENQTELAYSGPKQKRRMDHPFQVWRRHPPGRPCLYGVSWRATRGALRIAPPRSA